MQVYLIGTGVVGREILKAHVDADIPICVADQNEGQLRETIQWLGVDDAHVQPTRLGRLAAVEIDGQNDLPDGPPLVIESISERLDSKQALFQAIEQLLDEDAILCTNTSTLRIGHIGCKLKHPNRLCGMHFFMPVNRRDAVEVVRSEETDSDAIDICLQHVRSLRKTPIVVSDGPGFIVNRLLCPYLNQSLLLLGQGVSAEQLADAADRYGMPMSPLELMDWIGTRTMFDAGRVFWQSFPTRFEPSPILPALVKAQRFGRECGRGCYDYDDGVRSENLSPITIEICQRYRRGDSPALSDEEILLLLAIPMWIEAALAFDEGVAQPLDQVDVAMNGGLGYRSDGDWLQFFDSLGSEKMLAVIEQFAPTTKALRMPDDLTAALKQTGPTQAIEAFAGN